MKGLVLTNHHTNVFLYYCERSPKKTLKDLLADLVLLVVLHGAVQGQRQPAEVDLHGVAEPQHQPGPEQVAAGEVPGAEVDVDEAHVLLVMVLRPGRPVEEQLEEQREQARERRLHRARSGAPVGQQLLSPRRLPVHVHWNRPGGGEPRVRGGEPAQWRSTIHVIDRRTTCMVGEKYKHGGGEVP